MSQDVFKAPRAKRTHPKADGKSSSPKKKRRSKEDFFEFCNIVLSYTGYESTRQDDLRSKNNTSPHDSGGSTAESFTSESTSSSFTEHDNYDRYDEEIVPRHQRPKTMGQRGDESEDDSWELITCFCHKPFAGRPMIECSECLTWIHLSCAKIRKTNIPEEFTCQSCKDNKLTKRKSNRVRSEKKLISA